MSWTDGEKPCRQCDNCGMDMDMEPFCVSSQTLAEAQMRLDRSFPYGLNISTARLICVGEHWVQRVTYESP